MTPIAVNLSEHFSYKEMFYSRTAIRLGIDNTPPQSAKENLFHLCNDVLEPIRAGVGVIIVNSGFRCPELNVIVGGQKKSQHMAGVVSGKKEAAADIEENDRSVEKLFLEILEMGKQGFKFDQLIQEFDAWVHVSWSQNPRREILRATKEKNNEGKLVSVFTLIANL